MSRTGFRSIAAAIGVAFCVWRSRVAQGERAEMLRVAGDLRETQLDWEDRARRCRRWGEPFERADSF